MLKRLDSRENAIKKMIEKEKDRNTVNKLKLIAAQIRMFGKLTPDQDTFLKNYAATIPTKST